MKKGGIFNSVIDTLFPVVEQKATPGSSGADSVVKGEGLKGDSSSSTTSTSSSTIPSPTDLKGVVKQEMVDKLFESLNEADQPGIDFLEFYKAIKRSGSIRTADVVRNAFNMLGGIDSTISKTKLLSTAEGYMSVLKSEIDGFNQSFPDVVKGAVGESKNNIESNNREIEELNAQLASINARIRELNEKNASLSDGVAQQQVKLDRLKADFDTTSAWVGSDLQEVIELIKTHIQDDVVDQASK